MKLKALAALIALSSTTAFACPDLAGTFMCPGENGEMVATTVSQVVTNGVTVYTVTDVEGSYELIADGVTRTQSGQTQTGNNATIDSTNTCNADASLTSVANYNEVDAAGKSVASFKMVQEAARAANGGLALNVTYSENGGPEQKAQGVCDVAAAAKN